MTVFSVYKTIKISEIKLQQIAYDLKGALNSAKAAGKDVTEGAKSAQGG